MFFCDYCIGTYRPCTITAVSNVIISLTFLSRFFFSFKHYETTLCRIIIDVMGVFYVLTFMHYNGLIFVLGWLYSFKCAVFFVGGGGGLYFGVNYVASGSRLRRDFTSSYVAARHVALLLTYYRHR